MAKRFFKLLYIIILVGIALSLPIYLLSSIQFDKIFISSYRAKCNSNGQYVVLEGSKLNEHYVFDEVFLNDTTYGDVKKSLNFYCQNYNDVQPYIVAYANSKTRSDQIKANEDFFAFEEKVLPGVYSYPPTYQLEVVSNETNLYKIYGPIINWLLGATLAFIVLQIIRMCYVYVVYGKIIWHPFKKISGNDKGVADSYGSK